MPQTGHSQLTDMVKTTSCRTPPDLALENSVLWGGNGRSPRPSGVVRNPLGHDPSVATQNFLPISCRSRPAVG